jgi:hypothetical protein
MFTPYYRETEQWTYKSRNMMGNEDKTQLNNFLSPRDATHLNYSCYFCCKAACKWCFMGHNNTPSFLH